MNLFEGKSPAERNKIIVAIVLAVLALASLYFAFGPSLFGSSAKTTVKATTPKPTATPSASRQDDQMPSQSDQDFAYVTTPIIYNPGMNSAPDPGRNIFAFYEPPVPTPYSPTPYVDIPIAQPTPTPEPPMIIAFVMPQNVYAGAKSFRLEVNGTRFTPESQIYFRQSVMPTNFVSPEKLTADIPAGLIASEVPAQVIVQTPDGIKYSNQIILNVMAPPKPAFQYIGLVARKLANNDTAYFQETGKDEPLRARLNDVLGGRFKLVSISPAETRFVDTQLGFSHTLKLYRPAPSEAPPGRNGFPAGGSTYQPYTPQMYQPQQNVSVPAQQDIPGIPNNLPRANQQQRVVNGIPNKVDPNDPNPPVND